MRKLIAIARFSLATLLAHRARSAAVILCLVAILAPFLAGAGVARGLLDEAERSIREGADLYLRGARFGRAAPLPAAVEERIRAIPGVRSATPRVVGEIELGAARLPAVVVGVPAARLPEGADLVEGRLFRAGAPMELVFGAELARRLGLKPGARLPPFYRNRGGERIATVVGVFRADLPLWQANLVFCSIETAAQIFDQRGSVTGFLVECAEEDRALVRAELLKIDDLAPDDPVGSLAPRVETRADLEAALPATMRHVNGIFHLHFVLAFAVGVPLLMVCAGLGLTERRRDAALLKAGGWMTDELILLGFVESVALSLLGASTALLLAWFWLAALNGAGLAGLFLPGADPAPALRLPFRLMPLPALLGFGVALSIVSAGTILSNWRAATAAPALALR